MMSSVRVGVMAAILWLTVVLLGQAWAAAATTPAQGFTPEPDITISFPQSTFNSGEATTAYLTISGRTNGATILASVSGPGVAQPTVDVSAGSGSVAVTVPTTAGNYTYSVSATIDGTLVSDSTTITVIANRAPVATDGTATTNEDTPCQITFSATDPDGDPLTFSPSNPYTYTPSSDFNGEDTVTFTVSDGRGGTATGMVTITVNPVNDAPWAGGGGVETDEDVPLAITLDGSDVEDDTLTYAIVTGPGNGTLGAIDPDTQMVTYTPNQNWYGTDSFTYKVNDGQLDSVTATISIAVKPVGDLVTLAVSRYLLADGQDQSTVSVSVVDENDVPQPDTTVTLTTSGGSLGATTLTTDANGLATTTLTASTTPEDVCVTASTDDDTDEQPVTFFTFALTVSEALPVPDTTPPMYATGLGTSLEYVTVTVVTTPDIDLNHLDVGLSWTGGTPTTLDTRTIAKDVSGSSAVSATLCGSTQSVAVVVIEVTGIVADSTPLAIIENEVYTPDKKHAVTTWTATPNTYAVLKADVMPDVAAIHAVYNRLLFWSGGQTGATPDQCKFSRTTPSKTEIGVTCGTSGDTVTAWVAKVNLDIAGIPDAEEETRSATIYPNTDDDDFSKTADPPYSGNDLGESPVDNENDLVPVTLTMEPNGIGGMLSLTHGGKVALYGNADKSDPMAGSLVWDLSTRLDASPENDKNPPGLLWVEGREVSDLLGDQEFTLTHTWGVASDDTVTATVQARQGGSEATLHVYTPVTVRGQLYPGPEKYDPIGGKVYIGLRITLGPGERIDPAMNTVTVSMGDDYAYTGPAATATATWDLASGQYWYELLNPGTPQAQWVLSASPKSTIGNRDGSQARVFCGLQEWNTPFTPSLNFTPPMGHNGAHTVKIVKINGVDGDKLSFQRYVVPTWQAAYQKAIPAQKAVVKNLVVTNVWTSNGTEDYFKYDPDPESPYHRPTISFTIEDDGEPHEYDAYILMWPTSVTSDVFKGLVTSDVVAWTEDCHLSTGEYSKTWDGSLIPEYWAGHAEDGAEWSTYAFEVCVYEYPSYFATRKQNIDWFYAKWPYCLTVDDHNILFAFDDDDNQIVRCKYSFTDVCNSNPGRHAEYKTPSGMTITVIDPLLQKRNTIPIEPAMDVLYDGIDIDDDGVKDGIEVARVGRDEYPGIWRTIFTGEDNCWTEYRRDHQPSRMLAANDKEQSFPYAFYMSYLSNFPGHISLGIPVYKQRIVVDGHTMTGFHGVWSFGIYPEGFMRHGTKWVLGVPIQYEYPVISGTLGMRFIPTVEFDANFKVVGDRWLNAFVYSENGSYKNDLARTYEIKASQNDCENALQRIRDNHLTPAGKAKYNDNLASPVYISANVLKQCEYRFTGERNETTFAWGAYVCTNFANKYGPKFKEAKTNPLFFSQHIDVMHILGDFEYTRGIWWGKKENIFNCPCAACAKARAATAQAHETFTYDDNYLD